MPKKANNALKRINDKKKALSKLLEPEVLRMRSEGVSFAEIGKKIGRNAETAREIYHRAMGRAAPTAKKHLDKALETLDERDRGILKIWANAIENLDKAQTDGAGNAATQAALATAWARIDHQWQQVAERRSKLLGLDAPAQSIVTGNIQVDHVHVQEIRTDLLKRLESIAGPAIEVPALPAKSEPDPGEEDK